MTRAQILGAVSAVLDGEPTAAYDSESRRAVSAALSTDNPWQRAKDFGMSAFKADRSAADRLVAALLVQGVVLVPVGELEQFAPSLGVAKGRNWLPAALNARAHESEEAQSYGRAPADAVIAAELRPLA